MASVRVGSLFGIPIKLGVSFLLVVPVIAYLVGVQVGATADLLNQSLGAGIDPAGLTGGATPWLLGLAAALGLFGSVLLHELGHSLLARRYGLEIRAITLWFLGGLAQFSELPENWRHELAIAVIGPIVSVGVGLASYAAFVVTPADLGGVRFVLGYLAVLNVVLAAFNMLPGFPMDGGRVLRAALSGIWPRTKATRVAAGVGKLFAALLGLGGLVLGNLFWILIAFFIYIAATSETRQVLLEAAFEGMTVREVMTPAPQVVTVGPGTALDDLIDRMVRERHTGYPVVDERGDLRGIVTLEDVQADRGQGGPDATVGDVMTTDLVTVTPEDPVTTALRRLQREGVGRVLVVDGDGGLAGILSRTDLMTVLEIARTSRSSALTAAPIEQ